MNGLCRQAAAIVICLIVPTRSWGQEARALADFEDGSGGVFSVRAADVVDSPELDGRGLHMKKGSGLSFWIASGVDWSRYNCLRFDVYNPTDDRVIIPVVIKDSYWRNGYFWWVNRRYPALRGRSTVTVEMAKLARGDGGPKDPKGAPPLTWSKIIQVIIGGPQDIGEFYLDNVRVENADLTSPPAAERLVLADFDDGTMGQLEGRRGAEVLRCAALSGKAAHLPAEGVLVYERPGTDWSAYDFVKLDLYNPGEENARLRVCVKDDSAPHGYYSWINRYLAARPGKTTLELNLHELRRGEGTPKDMLDPRPFHWDNFWQFIFGTDRELYVDDVRVTKSDVKSFEGLLAFDFGPANSAPLLGHTVVSPETVYDRRKGFGWKRKGGMWARERKHPPDVFFGDWVSTDGGEFAVDVPGGEYKVWIAWTDPGEWEFMQNFTYRSISAEDKLLMKETMDGEEFLDRFFAHAEVEDHPGDDVRARYCGRFKLHPFDVTVEDGQMNLVIRGSGQYAATVNGVILYPMEKAVEGSAFMAASDKLREDYFRKRWLEKTPRKQSPEPSLVAKHRSTGYILFRRGKDESVGYFDAPQGGERLTGELTAFASRGEYESFVFSVYALRDLNGLEVSVSRLQDGRGRAIPEEAVAVRYVSWKFRRLGQSEYQVMPFILRDMKPVDAPEGTPRRFWATVRVPEDAAPGVYKGEIAVSAADVPRSVIPVELEVLPIRLPEPEMGLGVFRVGSTIPCRSYAFEEIDPFVEQAREKSLRCARAYGISYVSIGGAAFGGFAGKRARFDLSRVKAEYELCRRLGFTHIDFRAEAGGVFRQAASGDETAARRQGFESSDEMVRALYGGLKEVCRKEALPDPIWCFGDEPPDTLADEIGAMYKRVRDLVGARTIISYSPHGEPTQRLLDILAISCLNVATPTHMSRAKRAGNRLYVNNQGANRWAYGVWMHKLRSMGVEAYRQFCWAGNHIDPYYPLDGHEDDGGMVKPDRQHNMRPLEHLERIREGIDDYRYLQMMRDLAGKKGRRREAREALAFYEGLLRKAEFKNTRDGRRPRMSDEELDRMRRRSAEYILALSGS